MRMAGFTTAGTVTNGVVDSLDTEKGHGGPTYMVHYTYVIGSERQGTASTWTGKSAITVSDLRARHVGEKV